MYFAVESLGIGNNEDKGIEDYLSDYFFLDWGNRCNSYLGKLEATKEPINIKIIQNEDKTLVKLNDLGFSFHVHIENHSTELQRFNFY